jgi:hypothetical protein
MLLPLIFFVPYYTTKTCPKLIMLENIEASWKEEKHM